jgi:alkylated DNA repair dioxygenase AlkB
MANVSSTLRRSARTVDLPVDPLTAPAAHLVSDTTADPRWAQPSTDATDPADPTGSTGSTVPVGPAPGTAAAWAPTLFDAGAPGFDATFAGVHHTELTEGAWIDFVPAWLTGAAAVFEDLVVNVPWRSGRRLMYGQFVDEPRLHAWSRAAVEHCEVARPVIDAMATELSRRYRAVLESVGLNHYRDGQDSVAWHGDRIARDLEQSLVCIVSVGGHRPFRLRPRAGGRGVDLALGGGDLLVMGGTCQRTWFHAVPKVRAAPPRISITFRPTY